MAVDTTQAFTNSLDGLDVGWTRTDSNQLAEVLADVIEPPVVGAELPYEGLSLAESPTIDIELDPTLEELRNARTGVTGAALGIADYGSVVVRADDRLSSETASLFVDKHVVVLATSDVHPGMGDAMTELAQLFREEQASAIIATGPSATADMGALVRGAHGPKTVHVVLLSDR